MLETNFNIAVQSSPMGRCISPFVPRAKYIQPVFLDQLLDCLDFTAMRTNPLHSSCTHSSLASKTLISIQCKFYSLSKISPGSEQFKDLFSLIGGALASGSFVRIDIVIRTIPLSRVLAGTLILMTRYRIVR